MDSLEHFIAPPERFIKLSFDGASKGNPGPVGFRGLFRYSSGRTHLIYASHYGYASNNEAEFAVVTKGLITTIKLGYKKLVGGRGLQISDRYCQKSELGGRIGQTDTGGRRPSPKI